MAVGEAIIARILIAPTCYEQLVMKSPTRVARIFSTIGSLRQLTAQADRHQELECAIAARLSLELRPHLRFGAVRDGCLVLIADSPAWATRARYFTPELLANLPPEPEFGDVRSIRVRLRRAAAAVENPSRRNRLSERAGAAIESQAAATSDGRLAAALARIARHRGDS